MSTQKLQEYNTHALRSLIFHAGKCAREDFSLLEFPKEMKNKNEEKKWNTQEKVKLTEEMKRKRDVQTGDELPFSLRHERKRGEKTIHARVKT